MTVARPVHRRPGSTLYGYLVVEMIFPTLYTLGGLTLVVLTEDLVSLTELVINRGVSAADVAWLGLYQAVPNVSLMLPFAVLVGGLVALGRLGADRELLMLEASGISAPRIVAPVMAFAAVMAGLALALSLHAAPWANRTLDETLAEIERKNPGAGIVAGTVHRFGSWMLQAREVSPRGDRMRGVLLWTPSFGETVFAETGILDTTPTGETRVTLLRGRVILDPRKRARALDFERMSTVLPESQDPLARKSHEQLGGIGLAPLVEIGIDPSHSHRYRSQALLELHRRFALPGATLVFGLLIVPLFLSRAHFSRSGGGVLGILATLAYYGLAQLGESLVFNRAIGPALGAWLPNLVLGAVAVALVFRLTRMSAFGRHSDRPHSREPRRIIHSRADRIVTKRWPLERYVASRFLQMSLICFGVLLVGYLLIDVLERMSWMGRYGATVGQVMSYYGARIPLLASRVVPMALLVATALTVSVLAGQGELMGMRANGIPAPRALAPILVICALIAPAFFVLNNEVLPETNALATYIKRMVKRGTTSSEGPGAWFYSGERFFEAERLDPASGVARNITAYRIGATGLPEDRGDARQAFHIGNGVWRLVDPVRVSVSGGGVAREAAPRFVEIGEAIQADVNTKHFSVGDLRGEIEEVEAAGMDATHYRVDLFVKMAAPIACLILPALALFFAVGGPPHPSAAATLVLSAAAAAGYVLLTGIGTSLGYGGALEPRVAAFAPTALFTAITAYLGLRLRGFGQTLGR